MKPIKKELLVTGQSLRFSSTPQVDPEGQAAVREFKLATPAGMQNAGSSGAVDQRGSLPAIVQYATTAGAMANGVRTACAGCKNFDVKAWRKFVSDATGPASSAEMRQTIETMKARIKMAGYGYEKANGELDIDQTLLAHGICRPLSDWVEGCTQRDPMFWPVVAWREATCPPSCRAGPHELKVVTAEQPFGLFKPLDLDAAKIGAGRYDQVLRAAQATKK
jgi:hypothetical protein